MTNTLQPKPDPSPLVGWSAKGSVAVMFPRTKSAAYDAAVSAARGADMYAEQPLGRSVFHLAGFGCSREQASLALLVLRHMRSVRGFQAFAAGAELVDKWMVEKALTCYVQACGCRDPRAHCVVTMERPAPTYGATWADIFGGKPETFPCRFLWERGFRFNPGHPASAADQIQAAAVRMGCGWCPNLQGSSR